MKTTNKWKSFDKVSGKQTKLEYAAGSSKNNCALGSTFAPTDAQTCDSVMARLQKKMADAREAILRQEVTARYAAAELLVKQQRIEEAIANGHQEALKVLSDWVAQLDGRNIFLHIVGAITVPPFKLEITVGLLSSETSIKPSFFRQVVRVRKRASRRDVGIVFLPNRCFRSPASLHAFLNDEFLRIIAEPIVHCSRAYQSILTMPAIAGESSASHNTPDSASGLESCGFDECYVSCDKENQLCNDETNKRTASRGLSGKLSFPRST